MILIKLLSSLLLLEQDNEFKTTFYHDELCFSLCNTNESTLQY